MNRFGAFVLGGTIASGAWLVAYLRLNSEYEEGLVRIAHDMDDKRRALTHRETCQEHQIAPGNFTRAVDSGLYWPPGVTADDCEAGKRGF